MIPPSGWQAKVLPIGKPVEIERHQYRKVCEAQVEKGSVSSFGILRRDKTGRFQGPREHPTPKTRLDLEIRGGRVYSLYRPKTENGNSRLFTH
jgi:hypothetical protein